MTRSHDIRIGTTKSRTGCATCKQRRIKCDESKPTCQNCSRTGRVCLGYALKETFLKVVHYGVVQLDYQSPHPDYVGRRASGCKSQDPKHLQDYQAVLSKSFAGHEPGFYLTGGTSFEPFDVLPIPGSRDVQSAFDNLFRLQLGHMDEQSRSQYLGWMLNDSMFFETMIAFSKIALRHKHKPSARLTQDIRVHVGKVLQQLSPRVTGCQSRINAAIVLTIYYLLVIYQAAGEYEAVRFHLLGLRRIVRNRLMPGLHCSTGFIAARIRSAELLAAHLDARRNSRNQSDKHDGSEDSTPELPQPTLDRFVPASFESLATNAELSDCGLDFLENIEQYLGRPYTHGSKDRMTTLLALRMVESLQPTSYPPHALMTKKSKPAMRHKIVTN